MNERIGENMKHILPLIILSLFSVATASEAKEEATTPDRKPMSTSSVSLGYVVLYVKDVSASLVFYEQAFGLSRRFFNDEKGKAYGELETGAARLAFYNLELAKTQVKEFVAASPENAPLGFEIALITADVPALFARAVKAGATVVSGPEVKPWGQTVACVRDVDGHIVEITSPPIAGSAETENAKGPEREAVKCLREIQAAAEKLDVDAAFSLVMENSHGALVQNGRVLLTREAALESTRAGFRGVRRLNYTLGQEHVTLLAEDLALVVSDGQSHFELDDGRVFDAPFAQSVVLKRVSGIWKVLHAHRSFPVKL
jgi:lactoylglutathione lyase